MGSIVSYWLVLVYMIYVMNKKVKFDLFNGRLKFIFNFLRKLNVNYRFF